MTFRLRARPVIAALSVLALAACAQPPSARHTETGDGPTSPASSASSAATGAQAIRGFDFVHADWYDANGNATVRNGASASPEASDKSWAKVDEANAGNATQFGDLNGDGFADAVAWITVGNGSSYWHYAYVWLWDDAQHTAVQLHQPVTDDKQCGNVTKTLTISDAKITVDRLIRAGEACSDQPAHPVANTIAIEGGFPVRETPVRASTMPALAASSDAMQPGAQLKKPLKLAPAADAPELDLGQVSFIVLGGQRGTLDNGFHQVLFRASGDPVTWYTAYTDEIQ